MSEHIKNICELLDELVEVVLSHTQNDTLFSERFNWQYPAVNGYLLASIPKNLSIKLKESDSDSIEFTPEEYNAIIASLTFLINSTTAEMFNTNANYAIPVYINSLETIKSVFESATDWQTLTDNKALPIQLTRRLRSIQTQLDDLTPNKEELESRIKLINEATESAESLPTDLASLKEARNKVDKLSTDSAELYGKISNYNNQAEESIKSLNARAELYLGVLRTRSNDADKIIKQSNEAYRVATSTGLAAAFDERAKKSSQAVILWVVALILALGTSSYFGSARVAALSNLINKTDPLWGVIWLNIVLSVLSIGAPIWFAWLATKQINQRFRLSEDYAFKASVAKAYEGYRREAAKIDPLFEARLFSSALTRLEEAPLRFISDDIHGSPWHELFASKPFQDALSQVPAFKDTIIGLLKEKVPSLNKETVASIKETVTENSETP